MAIFLPEGTLPWKVDLSGKVAIVTGSSGGIGFHTAKHLCLSGAHVFLASRNMSKNEKAAEEIRQAVDIRRASGKVEVMQLDTGSMRSVRDFAVEFQKKNLPLDILVNNAGVWIPPKDKKFTDDGMNYTVAVNHFGPTYLTELLLDKLQKIAPSRVVFTSSPVEAVAPAIDWDNLAGKGKEANFTAYSATKLFNLMTVRALQLRLQGTGVEVLGAQPGITLSELWYKADYTKLSTLFQFVMAHVVGQSPSRGAQPLIRAAEDPSLQGKGMEYHSGTVGPWYKWSPFGIPFIGSWGNINRRRPENPQVYDDEACKRLYQETLRIIAQKLEN